MATRPLTGIRRRDLATLLAAAPLVAQTPPVAPESEAEAARSRVRTNAEAIKKVPLPMSAEPAFHFKV